MKVLLSDSIVEKFSNINVGVISVENIDNSICSDKFEKLLATEIEKVKDEDENDDFNLYNLVYQNLGLNLKKYMSSAEAIYTRVKSGKEIPFINPLVDLCNYISLKYKIPVGVYDTEKLSGDLRLDYFESINHKEMGYFDDKINCTTNWNWRQNEVCRVDNDTKNIIILLDGFEENKAKIENALIEIQQIIEENYALNTIIGSLKDRKSTRLNSSH